MAGSEPMVADSSVSLGDLLDVLERLPSGEPVELTLADLDDLRALTVLAIDRLPATTVRITVKRYRPPLARWRGSLGYLPGLASSRVSWPAARTGPVEVEVVLREPLDLSTVAAAVCDMLVPTNVAAFWGSPQLAVAPGTGADVLALLPQPWALRPQVEPEPDVLLATDILLAPPGFDASGIQHRSRVDVAPGPALGGTAGPLIDLRKHNPIGRLGKVGGEWPARRAQISTTGVDRWGLSVEGEPVVVLDSRAEIPSSVVELLRPCSTLDLSGIDEPIDPATAGALATRLAELAATGVVLHSGAHLVQHVPTLASTVRDIMGRAAAPVSGFANLALSVEQRRASMREHAGVLALGRAAEGLGAARMLPHVTALLVTNRPELVEHAVGLMVAQTYPYLDVLVVTHGRSAPDTNAWSDEARAKLSGCIELPASVPFGDALALATERAAGPLVLKIDDDDHYGPEFVWDLVLARLFSGAQVVGKQAEFTYLEPFDVTVRRGFGVETYSEQVAGGTMLMSVADIAQVGGWRGVPRAVDRALMQRFVKAGGVTYVDRGIGFVYVRHGRGHTWRADAGHFLRNAREQWSGLFLPALG
ncbi:glycosyltransferase [Sanguibacter hominis ATCC BAA-789]|uniref:Glycosyltransferase n=1 Tax=Sanguibacter hominis ATCC BAA-789 TaxID=1312740 RepID=A0A9X5FC42_9MICO|nr:glycosyltransferase [Sanguibacter hominis]NKX93600.1 glycosyltransferase [Sanguibacter hominis ATCC BAA-789]